jgi:hypothetical protein
MRERVEALGGRFQAGPGPSGGWSVRATIPPADLAGAGFTRKRLSQKDISS